MLTRKQKNEKRSLIQWGLRVPIWKINFCSGVLRLSELPRCKERLQTAICYLAWLGKLKCLATGLDASLSFLSRKCSRNRSPVVLLFHQCITFFNKCKFCSRGAREVMCAKWSVILMDLLGPEISSTLWMKGQVLHRKRTHLKVLNKLIDSQHYKRRRSKITIAFHLLQHFTFTTTQLNSIFLKL